MLSNLVVRDKGCGNFNDEGGSGRISKKPENADKRANMGGEEDHGACENVRKERESGINNNQETSVNKDSKAESRPSNTKNPSQSDSKKEADAPFSKSADSQAKNDQNQILPNENIARTDSQRQSKNQVNKYLKLCE